MFKFILHLLFSDFKFYRRRVGGTWYYFNDPTHQGGIEGDGFSGWTQSVSPDMEPFIVKKEIY